MKRCIRCILPETYPGIIFDENNICNYCLTYKRIKYKGWLEFEKLLVKYRNKRGKYDCVVPISGGKDSSFVIYKLVKDYGMRVLAYHYDSGFITETAKSNIKRIVDILGVDLVTFRSNMQKSCLRNNFVAWLHHPTTKMIPLICTGCRYGIARAFHVAKKNNVNLIISGQSRLEEATFKYRFFGIHGDKKEEVNTAYLACLTFFELLKNPLYWNPLCLKVGVQDYVSYFDILSGNSIKKVNFFDYIEWNEQEILSTIRNGLKWTMEAGKKPWRFDCKISVLKDFLYISKVGFCEKEDMLSIMIRENMITRDEALKRASRGIETEKLRELLAEVGLDLDVLFCACGIVL